MFRCVHESECVCCSSGCALMPCCVSECGFGRVCSCRGRCPGLLCMRRKVQLVFRPRCISSGMGVCLEEEGGGGDQHLQRKSNSPYQATFKLKLLSKPGNNCQAAIRFLLGGGKTGMCGRVTTVSKPAGTPEPPSLLGTPAKAKLHGPLLSGGTFLAPIHSLGLREGPFIFI